MKASKAPLHVFCSFAPEDADLCTQLHNHFRPLEREGVLALWHRRLITAGTDWATAIDEQLASASIILLLISPAFFASDYCYGVEMQQAIRRHETGDARVIPILIRPVNWQEAPFSHLSVLPTNKVPVTLWGDRDAAFAEIAVGTYRVVKEFIPSSTKTLLARGSAIWTLPLQRHPFFTGQKELLTKLAETLRTDQSAALTQPQAITGLGGIGKTQIAVEYAWQYRQDYQYVLWSRADTQEALVSGYVALAEHLNLQEKEARDQTVIVQAVCRWLATHPDWLLILDNADDLTVLKGFLPPYRQGHLLLTTRAQVTGTLAHALEVDTMPPDVGATLLLRRAGRIAPDISLDAASSPEVIIARAISEELGGLPLALDQAGAYIEETQCSLATYLEHYRSHRPELLKRRGGSIHDYPSSIATTWSLSFEQVKQQNPVAAEILICCAFLHPDAIPEELFTTEAIHIGTALRQSGRDALAFDEAVRVLLSFSLIHRNSSIAMLSIHRLVQAVLLDALSAKVRKRRQEQMIQAINAAFPEDVYYTLAKGERLLPHALVSVPWIMSKQKPTRAAVRLLDRTGWYLRERGRYREAEPLILHALSIREQHPGPEHPDTATSLNNAAKLYRQQGKDELAEPLIQRALSIREQHLGLEHPDTAMCLHNLAVLYRQQGKYELAEPLFQRSLSIHERLLGPEHPDTAMSLSNLAVLYRQQGKYELAELLCHRSLSIYEQYLVPEHPDMAMSLNNLAVLYRQQGKYELAEPFFLRAMAIREHALDHTHPDLGETLHEFAILRQAQGHNDEARSLYERSLDARTQTLGAGHPSTIDTREHLATLLRDMGRTEEAETLEAVQSTDQLRRKSQSGADEK